MRLPATAEQAGKRNFISIS